MLLVPFVCLMPDVMWKYWTKLYRPSYPDFVYRMKN